MNVWIFNLRHQRAFVKTVELGTLLAASRSVSLSQSAVTQAIARLESQLDIRLFERQSDGMVPTEAAHILYPRFKSALKYIRSRKITHTQIRAFLALKKGGSYAQASQLTGLARASLHRAVRDMEIILGLELVRRKGRGLEITAIGMAHARRFGLAAAELRYAIEEINYLRGIGAGRIAIGAMPLCRARVLPAAIVEYKRTVSESEIVVAEGSYIELVEPLRNGELDFLIGAMRERSPGPDLVQKPLFDDHPVIVGRAGHPLLSSSVTPSMERLAGFEWCVPAINIPLRDRWEGMFTKAGLKIPCIAVECGSVMTNRQILIKTDCLTILSPDQVSVELEAGWLEIVCGLPDDMKRSIGLTYREGWRPTESQSKFLHALQAVS